MVLSKSGVFTIMLSVVMLSIVMLSAVVLDVVAPYFKHLKTRQ